MATAYPNDLHSTQSKKRASHSFFRAVGMVPLIGEPICKGLASAAGRRIVEKETNVSEGIGLAAFSSTAKRMMERRNESGFVQLPDVLARSRLVAYYARRMAAACVGLGMTDDDEMLLRLTEHVSGFSKIGLYCVPESITNYEKIWGSRLPKNFLRILRECYPDFSAAFLKKFDDGSEEFLRAMNMLRYQQVAFDGMGSFGSPSYPLFDKNGRRLRGQDLLLEIQLTKIVEAFCAVLYKQMRPDLADADDQQHTEVAAATIITVSGKDVNPDLTAVLLGILFPPAPFSYTKMVVEQLSHPNLSDLENIAGEDVRYATQFVMADKLFRMLKEIRKQSEIDSKERIEGVRKRALEEFACETTQLDWPDDFSENSSEDTVPGFAVKAPARR